MQAVPEHAFSGQAGRLESAELIVELSLALKPILPVSTLITWSAAPPATMASTVLRIQLRVNEQDVVVLPAPLPLTAGAASSGVESADTSTGPSAESAHERSVSKETTLLIKR